MSDRQAAIHDALILLTSGSIVGGALVVITAAGLGFPQYFGLGLSRIGQLLFVVGFSAGAVYFYITDRDWPSAGMAFVALTWAVSFADWLLGDLFVYVSLAVITAGLVIILVGFKAQRHLRDAISKTVETDHQ